jgi:predicted kinase
MRKMYIAVGIPACGKTHHYKNNMDKNKVLRVSRDDINHQISDDLFTGNISKIIKKIEIFELEQILYNYFDVYIDRTNLTPKIRKHFINAAKRVAPNVYIIGLVFPTNVELSLERNRNRTELKEETRNGIEKFIPNAASQLIIPELSEGFNKIVMIEDAEVEKI